MDLIDKRDEVLRIFLEHGITENTENDLTKTDLAECAEQIVKKLIIGNVDKSLNEFLPLRLREGQRVVVAKNKNYHWYKVGDILRIIGPHYRNKNSWYCKKGWFGVKQVLNAQDFYVC